MLGIGTGPAGVDEHSLSCRRLCPDDLQHLLLLGKDIVKAGGIGGLYDHTAVNGVNDLRLVIGLIRVDGEQVQIGGQQLVGRLSVCFQHLLQNMFSLFVAVLHRFRHIQRHRDLLIVRQVLSHVGQGEEAGILQQEPGIHQRRHAGKLPTSHPPLHRAPVGVIIRL